MLCFPQPPICEHVNMLSWHVQPFLYRNIHFIYNDHGYHSVVDINRNNMFRAKICIVSTGILSCTNAEMKGMCCYTIFCISYLAILKSSVLYFRTIFCIWKIFQYVLGNKLLETYFVIFFSTFCSYYYLLEYSIKF